MFSKYFDEFMKTVIHIKYMKTTAVFAIIIEIYYDILIEMQHVRRRLVGNLLIEVFHEIL